MNKIIKSLVLPSYISDSMVIQQNKPILFHGFDQPNSLIQLNFDQEFIQTETDSKGNWEVTFSKRQAGGPFILTIEGSSKEVIRDILIGEVWLLGGQSNMELPVNRTYDEFKDEIDAANYPFIRQFQIEANPVFNQPLEILNHGEWSAATQTNIHDFSSLGFFYAKKLYKKLNVPIGIINTAIGGTPVESWMEEKTLRSLDSYTEELDYWNRVDAKEIAEENMRIHNDWHMDLSEKDQGLMDQPPWYAEKIDTASWRIISLPVMFKDTKLNNFIGAIWLRKTFEISEEDLQSNTFRLRLGTLINGDETYLNGEKIGQTEYRYPPRKYPLNKEQLKIGTNTLVIRLVNEEGNGGFIPDFPYELQLQNRNISLSGDWLYKIGATKEKVQPMLFLYNKPSTLYKGMIYPLRNINVRGVLFYQGESNTGDPTNYKKLMKLLIEDWRNLFGDNLPFYYVQLANYMEPTVDEDDKKWAVLRQQQDDLRAEIKNVEIIPAYDVGIANELHPYNKKALALRMASIALYSQYNRGLKYKNLEIKEIQKEQNQLIITTKGLKGNLLMSEHQPEFDLKVKNQWLPIDLIEINNCQIIIKLPNEISETLIQSVRYAWRNAPTGYIYDSETKLPLLPFKRKTNGKIQ